MPDHASIVFCDAKGQELPEAKLEIWATHDDDEAIRNPTENNSREFILQLREGTQYEYRLASPRHTLDCKLAKASRFPEAQERGRIDTGVYVGLLTLALLDKASGHCVAEAVVDIRSRKLGYDTDYRYMLEDIAERCSELLMELRSPVTQHFEPAETEDAQTLVQRLSFLKALLGADDFQNALHRIITMPNTVWKNEIRSRPICHGARMRRFEVKQLAKGSRRIAVPNSHALYDTMNGTIPERIDMRRKRDTVDTPENRFVKHALSCFQQTLETMQNKLSRVGSSQDKWITEEIQGLIDSLDEVLSRGFFREISSPDFLPLGSPVLQRKEGYREVLRAWLQFDLSARLCWKGGEEVYDAGKRDVAALYEYWVFFRLLDVVADVFDLDAPKSERLIVKTGDGFGLKLRAGRHTPLRGSCQVNGRLLKLKLSYNRTFARHGEGRSGHYPAKGSWTERMRPDYTLTLWPSVYSEQEAEKQELISHVHFDAKYKVQHLREVFGEDDSGLRGRKLHEDLDKEAQQEVLGRWKRVDLLKMHAYRDAIRRTAGAYILYPGSEAKEWRGFHEIIPGLGAFPLRPLEKGDGTDELKAFIVEVAKHVSNRASQREQQTYHTYQIHKNLPPEPIKESLPEIRGDAYRPAPPSEVFVLHGWHTGEQHLDWIKSKGLYNFRIENDRGSLRLSPSVAGASYLLVHGRGEYHGGGRLLRITSDGPRVFSRDTLIEEEGYPRPGKNRHYLVYNIEPLDADDPLSSYDWDLSKIEAIGTGHQSAIPKKGIPLNAFMKGAKFRTQSG